MAMTDEHISDAPLEAAFAPQVFEMRGLSVIVDADLARLFGVETKRLNQQTRRNETKFDGFAFQLSVEEFAALRLQIVTSKIGRGGPRHRPYVFTEHGVVMAATVLQSEQAIAASRFIIKVFVEARRKTLVSDGANLPSLIDARGLLPLESEARTGLMSKLNGALGRVLDAIADPETQTTVGDEAHAIAAEGLRSIKEYLKRAGVQNEKTLAEVRKLLAEADALEAETAQKRTENQHRQLALLAKQLRLVLVAQQYLETGGVEGLLATLKDLERP
ncbi:ORF6N domain-containing protein [Caulobacter sp. AP07]|nr:ORF6N domain-containing protein [Caulobacter sp. AP07]